MKKLTYISLALATLVFGCQRFDESVADYDLDGSGSGIVTVLEDGSMCVTASISTTEMTTVSVSTRATEDFESKIDDGWCLIFGEDADQIDIADAKYTDNSPLLMKIPIERNANGTFLINIPAYNDHAFLRIVTNLTAREEESLANAVAWGDDASRYSLVTDEDAGYSINTLKTMEAEDFVGGSYGTFGEYKYQSVGLDGIYDIEYTTPVSIDEDGNWITSDSDNTNKPDPTQLSDAIPMSSIGFVFDGGISISSLQEMFGTTIYMVRTCAKLDVSVSTSSGFNLSEIYMVDCAQESRLRSTVLTNQDSGTSYSSLTTTFGLTEDLGGTITYEPLKEDVAPGGTSSSIYFYPNSGGDYDDNGGVVDQGVNPQYVVIKGRAEGYDTDGYYKIALKGQYPLEYEYEDDAQTIVSGIKTLSDVSYDILRNTYFSIELLTVDKPGYKTLDDALDENNPASNISYNITILAADGRNEILISNGTYYVELNTTRIYAKGFAATEGVTGDLVFTLYPNPAEVYDDEGSPIDDGYQHPTVYVMADYGVDVTAVSYGEVDANGNVTNSEIVPEYELTDAEIEEFYGDGETQVNTYWYKVPASSSTTQVTVSYEAIASGRVRLRIGDMLKFIPVRYETEIVSYQEQSLTIGNETDFSYDESASSVSYYYLGSDLENWVSGIYDNGGGWFKSNGSFGSNMFGSQRYINALIYPLSADGITKIFAKQESAVNADAENDSTIINYDDYRGEDGNHHSSYSSASDFTLIATYLNYINTYTDYNCAIDDDFNLVDAETGDSIKIDAYEVVAAKILSILSQGYTTVYFYNEYSSLFLFDGGIAGTGCEDVFDLVEAYIDNAINSGSVAFTEGYTYSIDLSNVETTITQWDEAYFAGNKYIKSITLPSSTVAFGNNAFKDCTSLETVIVGDEGDPADFYYIQENVFEGCTSIKSLTIYNYRYNVVTSWSSGYQTDGSTFWIQDGDLDDTYTRTEVLDSNNDVDYYVYIWNFESTIE